MTILEFSNPIKKKEAFEHVKSVEIDNEEELDNVTKEKCYGCDSDDVDYDDEYISTVIELIKECSPSERAHLLECAGFVIGSYSDPNVASVSIKYDDTLVSKSAEGAIEEIARAFDGMYDREKALIISAMRLAIKQVRAGLDTSYIPLPKAEIDPHMFLMTEALQHSGQKYAICFHK